MFVSSEDFLCSAVAEWLDQYGVAIIIVEDHDVVLAGAGLDGEAAGLVSVDLAGGCGNVDKAGVDEVCFGAVINGGCSGEIVSWGWFLGFGGLSRPVVFFWFDLGDPWWWQSLLGGTCGRCRL